MKAILAVLVLFGILAALPEDKTLSASKKLISVSASQYFNDYQVNAEKANRKYRHKKIQITGKVSFVNSSCPDNPYVMVDGVECSMDSPEAMKSFSIGKRVSISGKGAGSALNIPFLTDCAVAQHK
jgi:putative nucleic acid binding protein